MKEELQSKLVEILTSIQTAAGKASDFALEQLPDIAQSYIAYGRAWETLWFAGVMVIALLITAAFVRLIVKGEVDGDSGFWGLIFTCFAWVAAIAAAKSLLLVWAAPKVWLLKEIAGLLK